MYIVHIWQNCSLPGTRRRTASTVGSTAYVAKNMRAHYDFSKMKSRRNPYVRLLKQPVTLRLDRDSVAYFKNLAAKTGLPYQQIINLYLRNCAVNHRELSMQWGP